MAELFQGSQSENDMPWQVKAVGLIGVPSVIALYAVYILAGEVRENQRKTLENIGMHSMHTAQLVSEVDKTNAQQEKLKSILQSICVNTSRTEQARRDCLR